LLYRITIYAGDELSQAFASSDLFVMPSDSETLGFVVIEALASGTPAIAVAAGGLVDTLENGETGFLVENNDDMIEFNAKAQELLGNPAKRETFGQTARRWAEGWSWEAATSKLRNVAYQEAIRNHRLRRGTRKQTPEELDESLELFANVYRPDLAGVAGLS
jgi:sulfoquinovosyltransferase